MCGFKGTRLIKGEMEDARDSTRYGATIVVDDEVAQALSLGCTKVFELIAIEGRPVIRFGRTRRVSTAALQQWFA
jgi:excisionase family DNA binding protein